MLPFVCSGKLYGVYFALYFYVEFSGLSLCAVILACHHKLYFLACMFVCHHRQQSMNVCGQAELNKG